MPLTMLGHHTIDMSSMKLRAQVLLHRTSPRMDFLENPTMNGGAHERCQQIESTRYPVNLQLDRTAPPVFGP